LTGFNYGRGQFTQKPAIKNSGEAQKNTHPTDITTNIRLYSEFVSLVLCVYPFKWSLGKAHGRLRPPMNYSADQLVPMTGVVNGDCDAWSYDENDQNP